MKLSRYELILKIAEQKKLTTVAEECNYTQSALSQSVRAVERELGVKLFYRRYGGVELTAEGKKLLPYIRNVYQSESKLYDEAEALLSVDSGTVTVAAIASIACHLLPEYMKDFNKQYPGIVFSLLVGDYEQVEGWVSDRKADIGFTSIYNKPSFYCEQICTDPLLAVFPDWYNIPSGAVSINDFSFESFIMLEEGGQREISHVLDNIENPPTIQYRVKDDYTVMAMVEQGLGISVLPKLVLRRTPFNVKLRPLAPAQSRTLGVIYNDCNNIPKAAQRFLEFMRMQDKLSMILE